MSLKEEESMMMMMIMMFLFLPSERDFDCSFQQASIWFTLWLSTKYPVMDVINTMFVHSPFHFVLVIAWPFLNTSPGGLQLSSWMSAKTQTCLPTTALSIYCYCHQMTKMGWTKTEGAFFFTALNVLVCFPAYLWVCMCAPRVHTLAVPTQAFFTFSYLGLNIPELPLE